MPPTYFQVCGLDPFRDEDLIFERILREENGIQTRIDVNPGLPHGSWFFLPNLTSSERCKADVIEGMSWLLGKGLRNKD